MTEAPAPPIEGELLARLREGDEAAFMELVDRHGPLMLRIALSHVSTRAVAEEVVQESWLGVLQGLGRFAGRSSLKTWIMRTVANRARTRGEREKRSVPMSSLAPAEEDAGPAVDATRFRSFEDPQYPVAWTVPPQSWAALPEERLIAGETLHRVRSAIGRLPRAGRSSCCANVEGWDAEEVCEALELSMGNQRVLLHRARSGLSGRM